VLLPTVGSKHVTPSRIASAHDVAERSAGYRDLSRRPLLLEVRPAAEGRLYDRAGSRIPKVGQLVLGVVRRAYQLGFSGARLGYPELAELCGASEGAVRRNVDRLVSAGQLRVVPQYRTLEDGRRRRLRNVYLLAGGAHKPRRKTTPKTRPLNTRRVPERSPNGGSKRSGYVDPPTGDHKAGKSSRPSPAVSPDEGIGGRAADGSGRGEPGLSGARAAAAADRQHSRSPEAPPAPAGREGGFVGPEAARQALAELEDALREPERPAVVIPDASRAAELLAEAELVRKLERDRRRELAELAGEVLP